MTEGNGSYVFRVAIAPSRIIKVTDTEVIFKYRRSGEKKWRRCTLAVFEFMRRYLQHVLPSGFTTCPPSCPAIAFGDGGSLGVGGNCGTSVSWPPTPRSAAQIISEGNNDEGVVHKAPSRALFYVSTAPPLTGMSAVALAKEGTSQ
ncbi:transposase [Pontiellaceae bacterium B1224]|nr:transposase [Pontiellaceae bacterium B1224]